MTNIYTWSQTPASNDVADSGINWAEFQPPDTVNNSARAMMARVATFVADSMPTRTSAGTVNSYTVTSAAAPVALTANFLVWFIADKTNTGTATLTVNALAAKPLRAKTGTALSANDIQTGTIVGAYYNLATDEFLIVNSGFHTNALAPTIASQYVTGLKVGDPVLSLEPTPKLGRIRLLEATQTFSATTYPELSQWLTGIGSPWGALTLPSAAGYFLRFAPTSATIDPAGARGAGLTQTDQNKSHTHAQSAMTGTGTTSSDGAHTHTYGNAGNIINITNNPVDGTGAGIAGGTTSSNGAHMHTLTVTVTGGTTVADGGAEVRTKNVAFHVDLIASAATANSDFYGINGVPYSFNTSFAAADPGTGKLSLNALPATAVTLYISETGATSEPLAAYLETWDDSTSTVRGRVHFYKVGAVGTFAIFNLTGTVTDSGTYKTCTIAYVSGNGTFANGDRLGVLFYANGDGATNLTIYTVATLPAGTVGQMAYASNGRKNGEGAGLGTGVPVFKDTVAWRCVDTGATVAA